MRRSVWIVRWSALLVLAACSGPPGATAVRPSSARPAETGRADIGGYSLAYECRGVGSPTVVLEAGYTASGVDTFGPTLLPELAGTTRVCT